MVGETAEYHELRAGCLFIQTAEDTVREAVSVVRSGRPLLPSVWPKGGRVAVAITFDVDHETPINRLEPALLSLGEYGATTAMPRLLTMMDRHDIPATFFVPGIVQLLHPQTVPQILASGRHEVGLHGWVHERPADLRDRAEEADLIERCIRVLTDAAGGLKPRGYRAPNNALSAHTLELLAEAGIAYDSSMSARDEPYELQLRGKPTDLIEIPMSFENDDFIFLHNDEFWQGTLSSPDLILDVWKSDFDAAYEEGSIFNLVLHPHVIGRRTRAIILEKLITYIKGKDDVWFATLGEVADYVKNAC
jgi:peptidoglycan-N-acetylglucosamine deacetylase